MARSISEPNTYSERWFATFLTGLDPALVARDVEFLECQLPRRSFRRLLDLCCGIGRHAAPLTERGYEVIGLDRVARVLDVLGRTTPAPIPRILGDMRALPIRDRSLDAVICMWQSFGQFSPAVNRAILADVQRVLRPGGRFVLDVYDRTFHAQLPLRRVLERGAQEIVEERWFDGARLHVRLSYDPRDLTVGDEFEWELYTHDELAADGASVGLALVRSCADFDERRRPSGDAPRMQLVFERPP